MDWDILDFAVFGTLLLSVGVAYALVRRAANSKAYKIATGIALVAAFLLGWVNGAVGIIGSENNDANMMFFGVIAICFVGALFARLRPRGMERALYATAAAQILVAVIALVGGLGVDGPVWPGDVVWLTGFFTALWLLSAWFFRKAARPTNDLRFR